MQKTCPFCRTEIDYYAVVCPNCTRHQSKDREAVFGEPPTLEQQLRSMHAETKAESWFGLLKAAAFLIGAIILGFPLLPILIGIAVLVGLGWLLIKIGQLPKSGGPQNGGT